MLKALILFSRIHFYRYLRMLNQLGIFRVVFLAIILIYIFKATLRPGMLHWQALLIFSAAARAHINRSDFVLLSNLGLNKPGFFFRLYLIIFSPFIILYLAWPDYKAAIILIAGSGLISLVQKPLSPIRKFTLPSFRFIPADSWEWRVGVRRFLPMIVMAYLLPALFYRFDYLFAASVLILSITANSFLLYHEPVTMFEALKTSPAVYLNRKILHQCAFFTLLALPLMLASALLYPEGIRPLILIFVNGIVVQSFAVSLKYAGYSPGNQSQYHLAITFFLNFAFILPALLPLPVIMTLVFGRKALNQLKIVME